ncbi:hypothetical protein MYA_3921 [Burkholderia sp. KJ006]|nr:hypothetical protein MYA_3921 [Burkholderia sp. KJ006]
MRSCIIDAFIRRLTEVNRKTVTHARPALRTASAAAPASVRPTPVPHPSSAWPAPDRRTPGPLARAPENPTNRDNPHPAAPRRYRYTVHRPIRRPRDYCLGGFYSDGNAANMWVRTAASHAATSRRTIPTPSGEQRWLQNHPMQTRRRPKRRSCPLPHPRQDASCS